jgi:hypothetical protein
LTQNMKFLDYGADLEKMDLVTEKLRNFNWWQVTIFFFFID